MLRVDRPHPNAHSTTKPPPPRTSDNLTRHKTSISLDLKFHASRAVLLSLLSNADVLIDPFRPEVLEKLGLSPVDVLLKINPRLIVARMTGFRRDGKYKNMAGHDINYLAVSGVLSMLGRSGEPPEAPGNILGDFAGGGAMCFLGILLALFSRQHTGKGQVVNANMVDGPAYLASFLRLGRKTPLWSAPRGENLLDGGCPYYATYETKDKGKYFVVGALEPQFFAELLRGLGLSESDVIPSDSSGKREFPDTWPHMRKVFKDKFKEKTRSQWEAIFDGTDACATPIFEMAELEDSGFDLRLAVGLTDTPGINHTADNGGWSGNGLRPGFGGEETIQKWLGWQRGREFDVMNGALVKVPGPKL